MAMETPFRVDDGRNPSAFAEWTNRSARLIAWLGLTLIVGSAVGFDANLAYPGAWAILPTLGAALVIAGGAAPPRGLVHPAAVWLGDRSYALYLWHWPVLVLGAAWGIDRLPQGKPALMLLILLLALVSYALIEYPLWKGRGSRSGQPAAVITVGLLAMLGTVAGTLAGREWAIASQTGHAAQPLAARSDLPAIYAAGCDHWYGDADLTPCVSANASATRTVALLGDSVGAQWASLLPLLYPDARVVILTKSACPIVDEPIFYPRIGAVYTVCEEWRHKALSYLETLRPEALFIGSTATYAYSDAQWRDGSRRILERLGQVAGRVYLIAGTPALDFDGPGCLARTQNRLPLAALLCRTDKVNPRIDAVTALLREATASFKNVQVLDLNDLVCPDRACLALARNGEIVFRDNQHVTDSFVRSVAGRVAERLGLPDSH